MAKRKKIEGGGMIEIAPAFVISQLSEGGRKHTYAGELPFGLALMMHLTLP